VASRPVSTLERSSEAVLLPEISCKACGCGCACHVRLGIIGKLSSSLKSPVKACGCGCAAQMGLGIIGKLSSSLKPPVKACWCGCACHVRLGIIGKLSSSLEKPHVKACGCGCAWHVRLGILGKLSSSLEKSHVKACGCRCTCHVLRRSSCVSCTNLQSHNNMVHQNMLSIWHCAIIGRAVLKKCLVQICSHIKYAKHLALCNNWTCRTKKVSCTNLQSHQIC